MLAINIPTYANLLSQKNMSVCMVSDDFLPAMTGVGVHLKLIAPELVRRGHKVCVITSRRKGEPEIEQWEGVTIYRVFTIKMYGFYQAIPSANKIREILKCVKPDLVHHHYAGFMMKLVCNIAQSFKLRQISTFHFSAEVLTQPLLMRPFRGLIRRLMVKNNNCCDLVMAPSLNLAYQIANEGVKSPVQFITNPVVFKENETVAPAERSDGFTVLYAGRLGTEKNIEYLIKSFDQLLKNKVDAILWIAGVGPQEQLLKNLCNQLNISDNVKFLGFLDHPTLARYYSACDIFVLPSLMETQGLVAMEAMWFGKPVILTDKIVSATELVEHGVNGYIVDASSVADLTDRMATLASNEALRTSMGLACRNSANNYRPELVVDAIEKAYNELINKKNLDGKNYSAKIKSHSQEKALVCN